jgi:FAD/FMN-containing dehydrogenase
LGGGTFGIVTKVTLKTHPLPSYFGDVEGSIVAKSDAAFKELLYQVAALGVEQGPGQDPAGIAHIGRRS